MGVDCDIYFPPQTRVRDVADVMATLLGHATRYKIHERHEACDVDHVETKGNQMPGCVDLNLSGPDGKCYKHCLFQYEADGYPTGDEPAGWRVVILRSTAINIALARRLVEFFGGAICYQDCDGEINFTKPARVNRYPSDTPDWEVFERIKSSISPLTVAEIEACEEFAAYPDSAEHLRECAPWLDREHSIARALTARTVSAVLDGIPQ